MNNSKINSQELYIAPYNSFKEKYLYMIDARD